MAPPPWPPLGTVAAEPEVVGCAPVEADEPVAAVPVDPLVVPEPEVWAALPLGAVAPAGWVVELPAAPEDCVMAPDDPPAEEPCVGAGCMAGEPEVVVPVPDAVGRSVPAEGGC
jgi:hypothetical protein